MKLQAAPCQHQGLRRTRVHAIAQVDMAFCPEDEDTVSMALTALHGLLDKHAVNPSQIGR